MRMLSLVLATGLALGGCSKVLGIQDVTRGDDVVDDADVDGPPADMMIDAPMCDRDAALALAFPPISMVSTGTVFGTTTGGLTTGTIDATAGGLTNAVNNPFVYVNLETKQRVDIDDVQAFNSTAWDIALRRSNIRVNGGDSGIGGRGVVAVPAATIGEVMFAPTSGYVTDDWTAAYPDCTLQQDIVGAPNTAFGVWYDSDNPQPLTAQPFVYVVHRPDGSNFAFRIVDYYQNGSNPPIGAYYTAQWKPLGPT